MHVKVDTRKETTDSDTRGGRLLLLTDERRSLAAFRQVFMTGSTLCHRMPLPCVHLLMLSDPEFVIELLSTHVARVPSRFLVN